MPRELKKFFSRKKMLLISVSIALLILFMPNKPAEAGFWSWISGITTTPVYVVVAFIVLVLGIISTTFAGLAGAILHFVIGPNFTTLSYTKPGLPTAADPTLNPIIKLGLDVTQNLANIILVLILVYIALAIILRLEGYETKKLLPRFVVVALLVNFTPVLCGLIVDASNIMMNYFAQPLIGEGGLASLITHIKTIWDIVSAGFKPEVFVSTTAQIAQVFKLITATVFYLFLALILLLYAGVFIVRYLAIWILVILSPIAFVCLILPKGSPVRRGWDMWWTQFIQWSLIGIFKMFFLYLGIQLMVQAPNLFTGNLGPADLGWFSQIIIYLVPITFLYLGWIMSMQTTAFGASAVIGLSKKYGKQLGGTVGGAVWKRAEEKGQIREKAGKAVQAVERVPYARVFIPMAARKYAQFGPAIDEARKKASFQSSLELGHRLYAGADYGKDAVGDIMEIIERGDSQDILKPFGEAYFGDKWGKKKEEGGKSEEDLYKVPEFREKMSRWLQIAFQGGKHNTILRSAPRLARLAPEAGIKGYEELTEEQAVFKAVGEARGQHIKNWEVEELKDETVIKAGLARGRDFWQSISSQVKKGHEEPLETVANIFKKDYYKPGMSDTQINEAWDKFHEDIKTRNNGQEGFFLFLGSPRAKEQGWKKDRIIEIATGKQLAPQAPTAPTPGEAAGIIIKEEVGRGPRTPQESAKRIAERMEIEKEIEKKKGKRPPEPSAGI